MTQFRKIQDGYIIAPRRGGKPTPPEGYEVAFGDPYVFLPILLPCIQREKRIIRQSCCGESERLYCLTRDSYVTRLICQECANED